MNISINAEYYGVDGFYKENETSYRVISSIYNYYDDTHETNFIKLNYTCNELNNCSVDNCKFEGQKLTYTEI